MTSPAPPAPRIAAITTLRNDDLFLPRWIAHYGAAFGHRNLFVFLDGHDQSRPICPHGDQVNYLALPHLPLGRAAGDRRRARTMSDLGRALHRYFDVVLATDVDEFLLLDPQAGDDLAAYLGGVKHRTSLSATGLDVAQNTKTEAALDPARPFLGQRRFAQVSARYTKPVISFRPVTWGSGMHRVLRHGYRIDPNLYLFHFGMVDHARATENPGADARRALGWGRHLERRERVFKAIAGARPHDFDQFLPEARETLQKRRQFPAWNKPATLKGNAVVEIPERFFGMV